MNLTAKEIAMLNTSGLPPVTMDQPDPFLVACPTCTAAVGEPCRPIRRRHRGPFADAMEAQRRTHTHAARARAAVEAL